jgi:hypothetical protein
MSDLLKFRISAMAIAFAMPPLFCQTRYRIAQLP